MATKTLTNQWIPGKPVTTAINWPTKWVITFEDGLIFEFTLSAGGDFKVTPGTGAPPHFEAQSFEPTGPTA